MNGEALATRNASESSHVRPHPVLELRGVSKTFGAAHALRDVDLCVADGEIHALVGHNGSGKSTLVKILAGYHQPDGYTSAAVDDQPLDLGDAQSARGAGLRFVHQELGLVDSLDAVDNVMLGQRFPMRKPHRIDWRATRRRVQALFERLEYDIPLATPVGALGLQHRTAVAIARALNDDVDEPRLLVFDEPTAAMTSPAVKALFRVIQRLKDAGIGALYISHHLEEIFELTDRVTVLRNGKLVTTRDTDSLVHDELVELMVGDIAAVGARAGQRQVDSAEHLPVLTVRGLSSAFVHDMSFDVRPGEIVGVAGLAGSGRDEVAGAMYGAVPRTGTVSVAGTTLPPGRPSAAIEAGLGLLTADRATTAAFPNWNLAQNVTLPRVEGRLRGAHLDRRRECVDVRTWLVRLGVEPADPTRPFNTLSGGNQQRVLLARWLRAAAHVVVMDEPTQGVDVSAIRRIYSTMTEFAMEGRAFVICSSDAEELALVCDRVLVMANGVVVRELTGDQLSADEIDRACLGGQIPTSTEGPER